MQLPSERQLQLFFQDIDAPAGGDAFQATGNTTASSKAEHLAQEAFMFQSAYYRLGRLRFALPHAKLPGHETRLP